jgi:hypothetical protein
MSQTLSGSFRGVSATIAVDPSLLETSLVSLNYACRHNLRPRCRVADDVLAVTCSGLLSISANFGQFCSQQSLILQPMVGHDIVLGRDWMVIYQPCFAQLSSVSGVSRILPSLPFGSRWIPNPGSAWYVYFYLTY